MIYNGSIMKLLFRKLATNKQKSRSVDIEYHFNSSCPLKAKLNWEAINLLPSRKRDKPPSS